MRHRLDELTAIRGIAALMVVLYHARTSWHPIFASGERFTMLIASGWIWVHFFFVLSGFVMMEAYGDVFVERPHVATYVRFVITRFGRIYPLHLAALAVIASSVGMSWISVVDPPGSFAASLLLVQGFVYVPLVWNGVAWSISTEWYVYLVFPLLVPLLARLSKTALRASAIIAALLLARFYFPPNDGVDWPPGRLVHCLLEFTLGCVVQRLVRVGGWPRSSRWLATLICLLPLFLMALPSSFSGPLLNAGIAIGFAAAIGVVVTSATAFDDVLGSRPLQVLGSISYSVYLWHAILFSFFDAATERFVGRPHVIHDLPSAAAFSLFFGYLAVLIALSWLSWRWIEEPSRRYFKRLATARLGRLAN